MALQLSFRVIFSGRLFIAGNPVQVGQRLAAIRGKARVLELVGVGGSWWELVFPPLKVGVLNKIWDVDGK